MKNFYTLMIIIFFALNANAQTVVYDKSSATQTVSQPKQILNYRAQYTNAEVKQMCEKCDRKVNKGQVNEDCSMCVGYIRGILSSVDEMNFLREKLDYKTVQICYKTSTIGQLIYNYIESLTTTKVEIDGSAYKSFVEFLAKNYPCETSVINDASKKDAFFENIETRINSTDR
jgi:hypothetical protein